MIVIVALGALALAKYEGKAENAYQAARQEYEQSKRIVTADAAAHSKQTGDKAYREEWRSEQDLKAQREMANWAFWMLLATGAGVGVTSFGVVYVKRTLELNRELLKETTRAINEQRELGEAQVRAYLTVSNVRVEVADRVPTFHFEIFNSGNSPAFEVEVEWNAGVDYLRDPKVDEKRRSAVMLGTIRPGDGSGERAVKIGNPIFKDEFKDKRVMVLARVTMHYVDVFKRRRAEPFDFLCTALNPQPNSQIGMAPYHEFHSLRLTFGPGKSH